MDRFRLGVNLGGWLSQFKAPDTSHFEAWIGPADIERIAGWGMDHVRLPIDYQILEDDAEPGRYKESGFAYIDRCLEWCGRWGLDLVLDMHRAPGYSFDAASGSNRLFEDPALQERLKKLWTALASRYAGSRSPLIVFELLNEIVLSSSEPWNELTRELRGAVRAADPGAWIMIGGIDWNSVGALKYLEVFDDPRMLYSFHFYEPMPFTHQKAYWADEFRDYGRELMYPGRAEGLEEFLAEYPAYRARMERYTGRELDARFMEEALQPAVDFMRDTGMPLYCGECGVIDRAPPAGRRAWYRDFTRLMRGLGIGFAPWSYKGMDFGLLDGEGRVADEEVLRILQGV
jgi:hypothetical protein